MEQNELNKVALELAIKSLDNKKNESKHIIIAFIARTDFLTPFGVVVGALI